MSALTEEIREEIERGKREVAADSEKRLSVSGYYYLSRRIDGLSRRIDNLKDSLDAKIDGLRSELKADLTSFRQEFKGDLSNLRSELKADIGNLRSELKDDISEVKNDISELKSKMDLFYQELQENARSNRNTLIGVVVAAIGIIATLLASSIFNITVK